MKENPSSRPPRAHANLKWLLLAILVGFALHRLEFTPLGALLFFVGAGHLTHSHPSWLEVALAIARFGHAEHGHEHDHRTLNVQHSTPSAELRLPWNVRC